MRVPLRGLLHPKAVEQLERYFEELIITSRFEYQDWADYGYDPYDENIAPDIHHFFTFSEAPLNGIERILRDADYLNKDDIVSICHAVLDNKFREKEIVQSKIPNFWDHQVHRGGERSWEAKELIDADFMRSAIEALVDFFFELPFAYEVLIPLPYVNLPSYEPFNVGEGIKLIIIDTDTGRTRYLPITKKDDMGGGVIHRYRQHNKSEHRVPLLGVSYAVIDSCGTGVSYRARSVLRNALSPFKMLIAAMLATDVLIEKDYYQDRTSSYYLRLTMDDLLDEVGCCYVYPSAGHRAKNITQEEPISVILPEIEWAFHNKLKLNPSILEPSELERVMIASGKKTDSEKERHKRLERMLRPIGKLFAQEQTDEHLQQIERIKTALIWFHDGLANDNQSFSFVQMTTAMETLLADPKEKKDIVKHLSDRCAYWIASNLIETKQIKKAFEDAYDVRSKIIHTGKAFLSKEDEIHYSNMKTYLKKVLVKVIESL